MGRCDHQNSAKTWQKIDPVADAFHGGIGYPCCVGNSVKGDIK